MTPTYKKLISFFSYRIQMCFKRGVYTPNYFAISLWKEIDTVPFGKRMKYIAGYSKSWGIYTSSLKVLPYDKANAVKVYHTHSPKSLVVLRAIAAFEKSQIDCGGVIQGLRVSNQKD